MEFYLLMKTADAEPCELAEYDGSTAEEEKR